MRKVEAILLKKTPLAEADELIYCYSKERGKLHLRAKGVKKPSAKLAGNLQRFNWLDLYFVEGKSLPIVTDVVGKQSFSYLKQSFEKIASANVVTNILVKILPVGSPDYVLWWQLVDYLNTLESYSGQEDKVKLSAVFFIYKMLSLHGFRPELDQCLVCRNTLTFKTLEKDILFSTSLGGLLHSKCARENSSSILMSPGAIEVIRVWREQGLKEVLNSNVSDKIMEELTRTIERFSNWHLASPISLKY